MDKKDIYEHLANIYLDASGKKKKKNKKEIPGKRAIFISVAFLLGFSLFLFGVAFRNKQMHKEFALVIQPDIAKINFNFDPAKKESYTITLNNLDLTKYKTLGFSIKKATHQDVITLRVEFVNNFKERSEVYVRNVPENWQEYKIPFSDFKKIGNWSNMQSVSFIIEDWNATDNSGIVYLDNIGLLRS